MSDDVQGSTGANGFVQKGSLSAAVTGANLDLKEHNLSISWLILAILAADGMPEVVWVVLRQLF